MKLMLFNLLGLCDRLPLCEFSVFYVVFAEFATTGVSALGWEIHLCVNCSDGLFPL